MFNQNLKIYVAGHKGLVGSAIVRELKKKGYKKIIVASRKKLDLTNQLSVLRFLKKTNHISFFWQPQKWVEYIQTTNIKQTTYMKI